MLIWIITGALSAIAIIVAALAFSAWRTARRVEQAVPAIGRFIEVDGAPMHFVDRGKGPPVVMIHGLGGTLRHYTGTIFEEIAKTNRVIAIDRPGCGYSGRPSGAGAATKTQAAIIQKLLDKLGIADPLIVGHSLGGSVALAHAVFHPGKARGYMLLAPLAGAQDDAPPMFKSLEVPWPPLQHLIAWTIGVPAAIKRGPGVTAEVFAPQRPPADFAIASGALLGLRPKSIVTNFKDFTASRQTVEEITGRYGEITAPVICLFGSEDTVLPAEFHLEALKPLPAAELQRLEGAGHMLMHVEAAASIAAIRKLDALTTAITRAAASS